MDPLREPWGGFHLLRKGYSVLGIKPQAADWYRGPALHAFFRSASFQIFLRSFKKVSLYGSSMGGFAALTFADACPGATAIAYNPQTTLDPTLVPWETRYEEGRRQDWSGDFADARIGAARADTAYIAYDPLFPLDRMHVDRLDDANVIAFKMPLVQHIVSAWMHEVGVLQRFLEGALEGTLTAAECRQLARSRRKTPRYFYGMGIKSRSVEVKSACLRAGIEFNNLVGLHRANFVELMLETQNWSLMEDSAFQQRLAAFDDHTLFRLLKAASDTGRPDLALAVCELAIRQREVTGAILVLTAECLWKLRRLQEAEESARRAVQAWPSTGNTYRILARILFSAGRLAEASDVARAGLKVEPTSYLGWKDLAKYNEGIGHYSNALEAAEMALKLRPDDIGIREYVKRIQADASISAA